MRKSSHKGTITVIESVASYRTKGSLFLDSALQDWGGIKLVPMTLV